MSYVIRDPNGCYYQGKVTPRWSPNLQRCWKFLDATSAAREMCGLNVSTCDIIEVASEQVWKEVGKV